MIPLHPKLVHLPIALAVLMPLLTSGLLLAWWRGWFAKRTWVLAVAAQALLVTSGWLAMRTGEAEEDRVEKFVPEQTLEAHEEAAEAFVLGGALVLVIALAPLFLGRRASIAAMATTIAGALAVLALGYRVGSAGGELVYRHGAAAAYTAGVGQQQVGPVRTGSRDADDR